jgi:hypothetical protein
LAFLFVCKIPQVKSAKNTMVLPDECSDFECFELFLVLLLLLRSRWCDDDDDDFLSNRSSFIFNFSLGGGGAAGGCPPSTNFDGVAIGSLPDATFAALMTQISCEFPLRTVGISHFSTADSVLLSGLCGSVGLAPGLLPLVNTCFSLAFIAFGTLFTSLVWLWPTFGVQILFCDIFFQHIFSLAIFALLARISVESPHRGREELLDFEKFTAIWTQLSSFGYIFDFSTLIGKFAVPKTQITNGE